MNIKQEVVSLNKIQNKVVFSKRNLLLGSNRVTLYESGLTIYKGYFWTTPYHYSLKEASIVSEKTRSVFGLFHHITLMIRQPDQGQSELRLPWLCGWQLERKIHHGIEKAQSTVALEQSSTTNIKYSKSGIRTLIILAVLLAVFMGSAMIRGMFAPTVDAAAQLSGDEPTAASITPESEPVEEAIAESIDAQKRLSVAEEIREGHEKVTEIAKALLCKLLPGAASASELAISCSLWFCLLLTVFSFLPFVRLIRWTGAACLIGSLCIALYIVYQQDFTAPDLLIRALYATSPLLFSILASLLAYGTSLADKDQDYSLLKRLGRLATCLCAFGALWLLVYGYLFSTQGVSLPAWYPEKWLTLSKEANVYLGVGGMIMTLFIGMLLKAGRFAGIMASVFGAVVTVVLIVRNLFCLCDASSWIPVGCAGVLLVLGLIVFVKKGAYVS